tara:strand:- start:171 stop:935 length:765 start_codon:yes stop_codon:yes gene_type:complete
MKALRTYFLGAGILLLIQQTALQAQSEAADEAKSYEKFKAALAKRVEKFDTDGKSFKEVIDMVRDISNINIVLDPKLFEKAKADNLTVNLNVSDISVKSILNTILRMNNFVGDFQNEILYITTIEAQFENKEVMSNTYDVRSIIIERPNFFNSVIPGSLAEKQLLKDRRRFPGLGEDDIDSTLLRNRRTGELSQEASTRNGEVLVEYIRSTIAPASWIKDERFNIKFNNEGTISVSHVPVVHLQILKLMKSMSK